MADFLEVLYWSLGEAVREVAGVIIPEMNLLGLRLVELDENATSLPVISCCDEEAVSEVDWHAWLLDQSDLRVLHMFRRRSWRRDDILVETGHH